MFFTKIEYMNCKSVMPNYTVIMSDLVINRAFLDASYSTVNRILVRDSFY